MAQQVKNIGAKLSDSVLFPWHIGHFAGYGDKTVLTIDGKQGGAYNYIEYDGQRS